MTAATLTWRSTYNDFENLDFFFFLSQVEVHLFDCWLESLQTLPVVAENTFMTSAHHCWYNKHVHESAKTPLKQTTNTSSGWLSLKWLRLLNVKPEQANVKIKTRHRAKCSHGSVWNQPKDSLQQSHRWLLSIWEFLEHTEPEPALWWRWHGCPGLYKQV